MDFEARSVKGMPGLLTRVDGFVDPILQNLVYNDLSYNVSNFNWASDIDVLDARAGPFINSIETDLSAFRNHGGKLIVYAGWDDPNISPLWSMQHTEAIIRDTLKSETTVWENDFVKLVMVPGGGHCGGMVAKYPWVPAQYGFSEALVDWVEKGVQPTAGVKSWGAPNGDRRTRRLCVWPETAKFVGDDVDDWESYVCG